VCPTGNVGPKFYTRNGKFICVKAKVFSFITGHVIFTNSALKQVFGLLKHPDNDDVRKWISE